MKTTLLFLILFLTALGLRAQIPGRPRNPADAPVAPTVPAFATAPPADTNEVAGYNYNFQGVEMDKVLEIYAHDLVNRTLLRATAMPGTVILKTESPLTRSEAIEAFQAVFALNNISIVNIGEKFVKVLNSTEALGAGGRINTNDADSLPELGSLVTHIVQLKYVKPSAMLPAIQPFAKLNSIIPIDDNGILIIRDYTENVKRMLEMIDRVDIDVPAVYISEVIPIKYAKADDIANALNSLGGSGGGTVSIGGSSASTSGSGLRGIGNPTGGFGGGAGANYPGGASGQPRVNGAAPGGAPGATPFQQQLQRIIAKASSGGQDQIQIFGQAKIIADQRANALLIFATRPDMDAITNVIAKLDVLLSQVLIESVIMEVSLGKNWDLGVSAVQNPRQFSPNFAGGGGYYNGQPFFNFVKNMMSSTTNSSVSGTNLITTIVNTITGGSSGIGTNSGSSFGNSLASGLSYFGQIGNSDYDVAVQAAESDSSITIIQKPRIQTFQAQRASFFVGNTVPYVTSTFNGGTTGIGSSYSQLSVGVSLDVTPFINPDGLVVMEIIEEIDDISSFTKIDGNPVPNTASKKLTSNVAVKDRDSIILGGAIRSEKDFNKSGVPLLQDIPILGALFSSRSSNKTRDELLVLMRPTVLRTPELASLQAKTEESRLPGIAHLEAQDNKEELKQVQAEEKLQKLQDEKDKKAAAKAAAKSGKSNPVVPEVFVPDSTNMPPDAVPANIPAPSAPASAPENPAAGLY